MQNYSNININKLLAYDGIHKDRLIYTVQNGDEGKEVQYLLKTRLGFASGMIKTLKYNQGILIDGKTARGNAVVRSGQVITALLNCCKVIPEITPEDGTLDIMYEDEAFMVINKQANTVMHPTCRHQSGTLENILLGYWRKKGIYQDVHLVGRLDKDTTGVVIIARNGYVQEEFKKQSESGIMKKYYIAAVSPAPADKSGVIDAPIMRDYDSIIKRKISNGGIRAVTHYSVKENLPENAAIVEFLLETGRTHQIRLHCSYMGFPIIGDTLYGEDTGEAAQNITHGAPHQLLHAYKIDIIHPITLEKMTFTAHVPEEWGEYTPHTLP